MLVSFHQLFSALAVVRFVLIAPHSVNANLYDHEKEPVKSALTTANIRRAVIEYAEDPNYAIKKYGEIEKWDTAAVTDMSFLFFYGRCPENSFQSICADALKIFNNDISSWDTSGVTSMDSMFFNCGNFNRDISKWNVRNVKELSRMFYNAQEFNADVGQWDVSSVTKMDHVFKGAQSFRRDLTSWNVG